MSQTTSIRPAAYTHTGGREVNEDSYGAWTRGDAAMLVVADGLGGCGNGDVASAEAVSCLKEAFESDAMFDVKRIEDTIHKANADILRLHSKEKQMKTTIAVLWLCGGYGIAAHVGDSRIYQFRNGAVRFQSVDHSMSQLAVLMGEITTAEIRGHKDRSHLIRALGSDSGNKIEIDKLDIQSGDGFLLCSDGFWELIEEDEMTAELSRSQDSAEWLDRMKCVVASRRNERSDNNTAVALIVK